MAIGFQSSPDGLLYGWRYVPERHFGKSQTGGLAVSDLEFVISELCQRRQDGLERSAPLLIGMIVIELPERYMQIDEARLRIV
jgi:hypothetical protein